MSDTIKYTVIGGGAGLLFGLLFRWNKLVSIGVGAVAGYAVSKGVGNIKLPSASV